MSRFTDHEEDTGYNTAFQDMLFGIIGVIAAVSIILLVMLRPAEENAAEATENERGNIRVEIFWPEDYDVDIDLWGQAPGTSSVGYSNKNGIVLSLVRDDLGKYADLSNQNYEVMFSHGLPPGEWTFNIHWFGNAGSQPTMTVDALVTITYDDSSNSKESPTQVVRTQLVLSAVGQEQTIVRFRIDGEGRLDRDSITNLFQPIRSPAGGSTITPILP